MAHRSIGQERFSSAGRMGPRSSLDELVMLINWQSVAAGHLEKPPALEAVAGFNVPAMSGGDDGGSAWFL